MCRGLEGSRGRTEDIVRTGLGWPSPTLGLLSFSSSRDS